jgi:hypothetical protein
MGLEITVRPGAPTLDGLAVELCLRSKRRIVVDALSVVGLCPLGNELSPKVLVPIPARLLGERRIEVRLRIGSVTPARVCCRAWLEGVSSPLVFFGPVVCAVAYPGLPPALAACLDEVCIDPDEQAFQMFVGDFCDGLDTEELGLDEVEEALRDLFFDD